FFRRALACDHPFAALLIWLVACLVLPAPTALYTLSLHDALPISSTPASRLRSATARSATSRSRRYGRTPTTTRRTASSRSDPGRSEEHTSELQSHLNLVCRLPLEKKNDPADHNCMERTDRSLSAS